MCSFCMAWPWGCSTGGCSAATAAEHRGDFLTLQLLQLMLWGTVVPIAGRFSLKFQVLEARADNLGLLTEGAANCGCEGGLVSACAACACTYPAGMEFSGTVKETGENVSAVKEGQRVIGATGVSAMAEECIVDEKALWQIPDNVSSEDAAVLPVAYGTAWLALHHRARLQPWETVLVTAGAGATGLAIIDLAVSVFQAKVIAAAGSDPKCQLVLENGASHAVNYSQNSLREQVAALTGGRGVDVAIEAVGGDIFKAALRSLVWEGRIVVMGFAGGKIPSIPANLLLLKNVSAMGVYWGRYQQEDFPLFSSAMSSLLQYCQEGKIHPRIGAVFKLEEVNEAFNHVLQRKSTGKVIISMK
uniref:Quinone oxidoreductase-like protein 2 n=1 Tax=Coturnix japonica TaxID=93934 RepID=A0A8C2UEC7_COTJA